MAITHEITASRNICNDEKYRGDCTRKMFWYVQELSITCPMFSHIPIDTNTQGCINSENVMCWNNGLLFGCIALYVERCGAVVKRRTRDREVPRSIPTNCKCCFLEQETLSTLLSTGFYPGKKRATWKISTKLLNVLPSINKVDYYYYYYYYYYPIGHMTFIQRRCDVVWTQCARWYTFVFSYRVVLDVYNSNGNPCLWKEWLVMYSYFMGFYGVISKPKTADW